MEYEKENNLQLEDYFVSFIRHIIFEIHKIHMCFFTKGNFFI